MCILFCTYDHYFVSVILLIYLGFSAPRHCIIDNPSPSITFVEPIFDLYSLQLATEPFPPIYLLSLTLHSSQTNLFAILFSILPFRAESSPHSMKRHRLLRT